MEKRELEGSELITSFSTQCWLCTVFCQALDIHFKKKFNFSMNICANSERAEGLGPRKRMG